MRRPLLMMRTRGLSGPLFGKHVGNRASHPLAHTQGNAISANSGGAPEPLPEYVLTVGLGGSNLGFVPVEYGGPAGALVPDIFDGIQITALAGNNGGWNTIQAAGGVQFPNNLGSISLSFPAQGRSWLLLWNSTNSWYEDISEPGTLYDFLLPFNGLDIICNVTPPNLGPELVLNGSFSSDTSWDKGDGWTIASGFATGVAGAGSNIQQAANISVGVLYRVSYDVVTVDSGGVYAQVGGANGTQRVAPGHYEEDIVADDSNAGNVNIRKTSTFAGQVDNFSIREILGASAARNVDYQGQQVIYLGEDVTYG